MRALKLTTEAQDLSRLESSPVAAVKAAGAAGRALVFSREGREEVVLMSMTTFDTLHTAWKRQDLLAGIEEAERQVTAGDVLEHDEAMAFFDSLVNGEP